MQILMAKPCMCQTITLNPQVSHVGSFFHDHTGKSWRVLTQQPGLAPMMI